MNFDQNTVPDDYMTGALQACRRALMAVAGFSFCENVLLLAAPLYMMQVYDRVLASRSLETLGYLTLITALALVTLAVINLARHRILASISIWFEQRLAPRLFEAAIQSRLQGRTYGPEALADVAIVRGYLASPSLNALFDLPWVVVFVAAAFLLHPYFGLLAIGCAAALLALAAAGEWATRTQIQAVSDSAILLRRQLDATVRNAEVVESMGMMRAVSVRWMSRHSLALAMHKELFARTALTTATAKFVRLFIQTLTLGLGAWLVVGQQATGGVMIAASIVLARALMPFEQVIGSWKTTAGAFDSYQRLRSFSRQPPYRPNTMPLPPPAGALSVEEVSYRPNASLAPILQDVSFSLSPGESLAIIGPSGSGKSSLVRLLVGVIQPTAGFVRLDQADIFGWNRDQIRDHLGYLPQDVELFAGTVAENIARMGAVVPEAVTAAAKMADVHDLILRLPNSYETDIGEGGQHLSGGQRQRIGLARALYGNPRLIVLDEPNANLDADGEIALMNAISMLKAAGTTVVVVTHRASLLQQVDRVLLLRDGRVEGFQAKRDVLDKYLGPLRAPPINDAGSGTRRAVRTELGRA